MTPSLDRSAEITIPASDLDDQAHAALLSAVSDPVCRSILAETSDRQLTAAELADASDLPLSTVYRKLKRLTSTPLIEETYRLPTNGKNPRQYRCVIDHVAVAFSEPISTATTSMGGSARGQVSGSVVDSDDG